jgi:hypothetical protein
MAVKNRNKKPAPVGSVKAWLYTLLIAGLIIFVFPDVFVLAAVGMVPTIGAFVIDRTQRRYFTTTVAFANFTGVLPSAITLFSGGSGGVEGALEVVSDPLTLLSMYGAGAIGWFIHYMVPPFVSVWLAMSHEMKTMAIKKRQQELVDNWGKNIRVEAAKYLPDNVRLAQGIGESNPESVSGDASLNYSSDDEKQLAGVA